MIQRILSSPAVPGGEPLKDVFNAGGLEAKPYGETWPPPGFNDVDRLRPSSNSHTPRKEVVRVSPRQDPLKRVGSLRRRNHLPAGNAYRDLTTC